MKHPLPIQKLLDFRLLDDCILYRGHKYYFYRYTPPNRSIMTDDELKNQIKKDGQILDILRRPICLFITDKVEDLSENKKFYSSMAPEFEYITSEIVGRIEDTEVKSASVQRSFYYVFRQDGEDDDVLSVFVGRGYQMEVVNKKELAQLMRNYTLREFINTDIYTIEKDVAAAGQPKKLKEDVYNREILRRILPYRIDFNIFHADQGNYLRKTIMVKNFPAEIPPAAMLTLASIRGTTFTMRLSPMAKDKARKLVDSQIRNRGVQSGSRRVTEQVDAQQETDSLINFYTGISRNQNAIYHTNIFVEMYGKTKAELAEVESRVTTELGGIGVSYEELKYMQQDAFQSVQPMGTDMFLPNANNMPSNTVAALYPCSFSCRLDPHGIYLGRTAQGGIFFLDLFLRNNDITTGSYVALGQPGQGKSYTLKKITSQLYVRGFSSYILDVEDEYSDMVRQLGGTVYNMVAGRTFINPFEVRQLKAREDESSQAWDDLPEIPNSMPVFNQHLSWLADFHHVLFPDLDAEASRALMILIQEMYKKFGIDGNTDFSKLSPTDYPIYTDLYNFIDNLGPNDYIDLMSTDLRRKVKMYIHDCAHGALKTIFDGHTNIKNDRLVSFQLNDLLVGEKRRLEAVIFNITTYIWNAISKRERFIELKVEELHIFLQSPYMIKYLSSFVKRCRKYDALLGVSTQQLADCFHEEFVHYTTSIFNSSAFKFLFFPGDIDLGLMQKKLKLTDGEINCISQSNKKHCLVKAGNQKYYIEVGTLDYEEMLFGKGGGT